jgi:DNA-binding CsgD family transcriptional regulator
MLAGDLRGARLDGTSAWTAAQALEGWGVHLPYLASVLVELDVETGARDSANIGDDDELVGPDRSLSSVQRFLTARAHEELSSQRFDTALQGALATGSWADERGTRNPVIRWRSVAADALRALGRHEQARAVAADDLREAQRFGAAREISMGLRSVARSATRDEQFDLYTQAVAVVEGTEARLEHANALAGLGGALRRAGHPRDARGHLEAALRHADRCGARPLVDAISRELVACGSRPRPPAYTGADELTPAQLRVAELAASGSTNQQIAQQLFLSLKTVEMHLNHGYRRLGISRRADLPDALTAAVA